MKLWAISDLHVGFPANRDALATIGDHPGDWLILGGDLGESEEHVRIVLDTLAPRFAQLLWVPGNHELWTMHGRTSDLRGDAKYQRLVEVCREYGALTPEDPWVTWPGPGPRRTIAPMFLLFDYSFGPDGLAPDEVVAWAADGGIRSADERYLYPDPYPSLDAWCAARLAITRDKLAKVPEDHRLILINHWPLRRDLLRLYRIPRFTPWCGTRHTESWHRQYGAEVVVHGHLHMRATDWRDGTRFEEVAVGYPRHWKSDRTWDSYLREILPGPSSQVTDGGPRWHW